MPDILVRRDDLNERNGRFAQAPLREPVFLNSVPKSGSHLLRNIVRMFVPVEQQYAADFIQWPNLQQHRAAFSPERPMLSWGHLLFADASAIETGKARRVLLYRDPYEWVIARARFMLSDQFSGNVDHLSSGALDADELLTLMIFGVPGKLPSLNAIYELNAAAWLGTRCHVVTYESLVAHLQASETTAADDFFGALLAACGIDRPADWRERIAIGADREQSGTARENLTGVAIELPHALPAKHQALVDYQAPGLRRVLGYV